MSSLSFYVVKSLTEESDGTTLLNNVYLSNTYCNIYVGNIGNT